MSCSHVKKFGRGDLVSILRGEGGECSLTAITEVTDDCLKDESCSWFIRLHNSALGWFTAVVFPSVSEIRDPSAVSCNRNYESIATDVLLLIRCSENWAECDDPRTGFCGAGGSKALKTEPYRCGWIFTPLTAGSKRCQVWKKRINLKERQKKNVVKRNLWLGHNHD
jgi:hypothetical protein